MSKFIHFSMRSLNQSPTVESISSGYTFTGKKVWKADKHRWLNWSDPASQKYGQNSSNISRVALAFSRFIYRTQKAIEKKHLPLVRLELTTSASLYVYKYSALTDCATGAGWPSEDEKSKPRPGKYTDACLHAVFAVDLALSWWIIKNLKISKNKISNVVI